MFDLITFCRLKTFRGCRGLRGDEIAVRNSWEEFSRTSRTYGEPSLGFGPFLPLSARSYPFRAELTGQTEVPLEMFTLIVSLPNFPRSS